MTTAILKGSCSFSPLKEAFFKCCEECFQKLFLEKLCLQLQEFLTEKITHLIRSLTLVVRVLMHRLKYHSAVYTYVKIFREINLHYHLLVKS